MSNAWGAFPEQRRIDELTEMEGQWHANPAGRPGPFAGTTLTGADVFWLAALALAGPGGNYQAAEARLRFAQNDPLLRVSLDLSTVNLRGAVLSNADLKGAILGGAHLEGAILGIANLEDAFLGRANLEEAFLDYARLRNANLSDAQLNSTSFRFADLTGCSLKGAEVEDSDLAHAILEDADINARSLARTDLSGVSLHGRDLRRFNLQETILFEANLERASLIDANMQGADLRAASLDVARLNNAHLEYALLDQTSFYRTNLAVVSWPDVPYFGDELIACQRRVPDITYLNGRRTVKRGKRKSAKQREEEYIAAARAYRSLSVELRAQGIIKEATRFYFRAEVMSRRAALHRAVRRLRSPLIVVAPVIFLPWLLSLLLSVVAGYGVYHVWRLAITYLAVVGAFALAYWLIGAQANTGLNVLDAVVLSLTSFHGRGLQPTGDLTDLMRAIAGAEAVLGLLIEGLFIAAFTRRLTGN